MHCFFEKREDLGDIFAQIKDVDEQIFSIIIEMIRNEEIQDIIGYLLDNGNQRNFEAQILQGANLAQGYKEHNLYCVGNNIKKIINVIKKIKDHEFNNKDYSTESNEQSRQDLIEKIRDEQKIIEYLKVLVHLTSIENTLIQCGSNSLKLLVGMKADLSYQNFEKIKIQNTSLVGVNLVRYNLSGQEFKNVDISGMNLNGAQLLNSQWKHIKLKQLNQLNGHTSIVRSVCFSPDGNLLASGSDDNSIRLWDVKTGQQKFQLDGHSCGVNSVCFSPNGTTLASGSNDNSFRLWDIKTGQQKSQLNGHGSAVYSVCFSPDGTTLAYGSCGNSIFLWDIKTRKQIAKLNGKSYGDASICFSPDGTTLASGSDDNSIRLWDVKTGQQRSKLDGHTYAVRSLCFSPDVFIKRKCPPLSPLKDLIINQQQ